MPYTQSLTFVLVRHLFLDCRQQVCRTSLLSYRATLTSVTFSITGGNDSLSVVFGWNTVINLFYMPGTLIGAFVVDIMGPKYTMVRAISSIRHIN